MGIDEIKSNGLNKIHQIKQEQTKKNKPKDTEFQGEKGRDLLGVQGDARTHLIKRIDLSPKTPLQNTRLQSEVEYKPMSEEEMEAKYGYRFYDYTELSKLSQDYPEIIGKLLELKKTNGDYRFDSNDFERLEKAIKKYPELILKFAEMKTSDAPNANYRFRPTTIQYLAENYEEHKESIDNWINLKTTDGEYRLDGDVTMLVDPMERVPQLVQTLIDSTNFDTIRIYQTCEELKPEDEEFAIELAKMKNPEGSSEPNRFNYNTLPESVKKAKRFPIMKELIRETNTNGEYKYDLQEINHLAPILTKEPEMKELLKFVPPYDLGQLTGKDKITTQIIEHIKSENYNGSSIADIRSCLECNLDPTPENIEFASKCESLMTKNIFYSDSRDFIPETLKKIKPDERATFIKWLEFCNEKASEADEPNWFDDSNNDKKNVVQNMTFFVENSEIRKAPEKYIELMNYLPEDVSLQDKIYAIFEKGEITAEEIDHNIEAQKLVNEDKSLNGENILNTLYNERFYEKEDKAIYQNITAKNFIELYKKLHSIQNKIGLTTTDYVNILSNPDLTDEMIKNTTDLIKEQKEIKPPLKEITLATLSYGDPESYSHYSKWLNIIAENFNEDLGLYNKLDYVINTVSNYIASETDAEVKLVESLVQSDILDAIKSGELSVGNINIEHIERTEEELIKREDIEDETDFEKIIQYQKQEKQKLAKSLLDLIPKAYVIEEILKKNQITKEILYNNSKSGIFELIDKVKKLKDKILENSDNYVNGDDLDEYSATAQVIYFFKNYQIPMIRYMQIADKETLDVLLRKRFDDAGEYLQAFGQLSSENRQLLKEMSESTNISGKPFMPTQKIEFIDLLMAYQNSNISTDKIKEMINKGKIDIADLNIDLFREIMKSTGLTDEEIATIPTEKLVSWDMKYAHLLAKGIDESDEEDNEAFNDVIKAATLSNFGEYIEDESNIYGQTNKKTEAIFQEMGLDYKNWKTPPKDLEIHFVAQDSNTEQLTQIVSQITEDMNTLMQTPVKGFLKKQFPKCIKGDSFVIPHEIANNKNELIKFVTILTDTTDQGQLTQVWKRAQGNINNPAPNRVASAKNTLTILDHLNQRLDDLSKIKDLEQVDENGKKIKAKTQNLDLTIKMWDRIPQKDIFQGNYSTCCIGMGGGNEGAMPHYLLDTAFNIIEFVDNNTRETMGNALCFFIKDEKGEPAFIIDNIEYKNNAKPSDEVGLKLRDAITQYAQNVARTVTGKDTTSIYIGGNYNDVPDKDLESHKENISFLGEIDCSSIYLDLYNGWTNKDELKSNVKLWKLK